MGGIGDGEHAGADHGDPERGPGQQLLGREPVRIARADDADGTTLGQWFQAQVADAAIGPPCRTRPRRARGEGPGDGRQVIGMDRVPPRRRAGPGLAEPLGAAGGIDPEQGLPWIRGMRVLLGPHPGMVGRDPEAASGERAARAYPAEASISPSAGSFPDATCR